MATPFPRPRAGGRIAWYVKLSVHGVWKNVLLKGCKTEKQAQKLADELEVEYARLSKGLAPGRRFRGTFHELCEWAYGVHFQGLRAWRSDRSRFNNHACPGSPLGKLAAERVTSDEIETYLNDVAKTPTVRGKPPSAGSLNRLRTMFSIVFAVAHKHNIWPDDNPALRTTKRDVVRQSFSILELHEIGPVLEQVTDYWRGVVAVGLLAGLRRGEILALHKSDVDLLRRQFIVQRSNEFLGTKGSMVPERVPIHEALLPYLEPWLRTPGELLFPNVRGEQRPRTVHLERVLRTAMVRAGICDWYDHTCRRCAHVERQADNDPRWCPACGMKLWPVGHARHVRFHDTRHTFASHALMSGASIQSVQKVLRHKDPRLTVNTYGHLNFEHLAADVNRIAVPGLATAVDRRPPPSSNDNQCEHPAPLGKAVGAEHQELGAPVVRVAPARAWQAQKTASDPLDSALRQTPPVFPTCATSTPRTDLDGSQPLATARDGDASDLTRSRPLAPSLDTLGAPVVRIRGDAHQDQRDATPGGSRADMAGVSSGGGVSVLLTVREVAERLSVSRDWVYRHINAGELVHVRKGPRVLVPEPALAGYLEHFAGLRRPPTAPVVAEPAAVRRGKEAVQ